MLLHLKLQTVTIAVDAGHRCNFYAFRKTYRVTRKALSADMNGQCFRMLSQNEISLFFENFMKMSIDTTVSTFRIVANAAAGPSDPRDTCV